MGADRRFAPWGKPLAVAGTAARIAGDLPEEAWRRLSAGDGTKGGRLYDWVCIELADPGIAGTWTRGLPGRRTVADGDPAFFPHGVPPARTSGNPAGAGGAAGCRGVFPDRQNRARPRPHRDTVVAWPAPSCFPGYARLCDDGHGPVPRQRDATAKKTLRTDSRSCPRSGPRSRGRCRKSAASPPDSREGGYVRRMSSRGHFGDGPTRPPHGNPIPIPIATVVLVVRFIHSILIDDHASRTRQAPPVSRPTETRRPCFRCGAQAMPRPPRCSRRSIRRRRSVDAAASVWRKCPPPLSSGRRRPA